MYITWSKENSAAEGAMISLELIYTKFVSLCGLKKKNGGIVLENAKASPNELSLSIPQGIFHKSQGISWTQAPGTAELILNESVLP